MLEESIALATVIPEGAVTIVLDERGKNLDSLALTRKSRAGATPDAGGRVFVIGGADGLAASLRERADLRWPFGAATWPHQLVRIMLLEQVYRAATLLAGHPYHRGQAKK